MLKVLLIEDDFMIAQSIQQLFELENIAVHWVNNGIEGLQCLSQNQPDLVLLDIGLPSMSGFEVLNKIRAKSQVAVIVISARDQVEDRLNILKHGGDDYLTKPFDFDELIARIYAVLRRTTTTNMTIVNILQYKGLKLDLTEHQAFWNDKPIVLSKKEWILMENLLNTPLKIFSKDELEEKIYLHDSDINSNTIEVYIHKLRQKLNKNFIRTIRGFGYRLE
ncbi:MAG: response regulator transcription factor [Acinetobacter populi]|jgi:DNA-binding response OmpR family regulator|uniref:response regulator transcription factor n=1 Tax=Acinetobacter populi TaxID=1582270 RepID=UPI00235704A9|nr:response regulator transcription factor [Acinetobacter populi]MCH4248087.1 response regulator transcription factor [Acinetobacter populi]